MRTGSGSRSATSSRSTQATWSLIRDFAEIAKVDVTGQSDDELAARWPTALQPPPSEEEQEEKLRDWDPVDLLVPEWRYLLKDPIGDRHEDPASGLTLSRRDRDPQLRPEITRVLAAERLRKVNALTGFTRIDAFDRVGDVPRRLVPLTRERYPDWTVATEDRGEGVFLQLDEERVAAWEQKVLASEIWEAHRQAHRRNFNRRFSETAENVDRGRPAEAAAVLAGPHPGARADPGHGHGVRVLSREPERAAVRLARDGRAPARSRAADRHHGIGQRRHPRRPGLAERAGTPAAGGVIGAGAGGTLLLGPDLRPPHARRPGRLPARRGLPLLRDGIGDVLRAGQPVPGPAVPHQPPRKLPWLLRMTRPGSSARC